MATWLESKPAPTSKFAQNVFRLENRLLRSSIWPASHGHTQLKAWQRHVRDEFQHSDCFGN